MGCIQPKDINFIFRQFSSVSLVDKFNLLSFSLFMSVSCMCMDVYVCVTKKVFQTTPIALHIVYVMLAMW